MIKAFILKQIENKPLWNNIIDYEGKQYKVMCDQPHYASTNDWITWEVSLEVEEMN